MVGVFDAVVGVDWPFVLVLVPRFRLVNCLNVVDCLLAPVPVGLDVVEVDRPVPANLVPLAGGLVLDELVVAAVVLFLDAFVFGLLVPADSAPLVVFLVLDGRVPADLVPLAGRLVLDRPLSVVLVPFTGGVVLV